MAIRAILHRLKAASREQTQLASGLSQKTLDAFGIVREQPGVPLQSAAQPPPTDTPETTGAGALESPAATEAAPPAASVAKNDAPEAPFVGNEAVGVIAAQQQRHAFVPMGEDMLRIDFDRGAIGVPRFVPPAEPLDPTE